MTPVEVKSAARFVCQEANWSLRVCDLERLLFVVHMDRLGRHGEPFLPGEPFDVRRASIGPVLDELDKLRKVFGGRSIKPFALQDASLPSKEAMDYLSGAVASLWSPEESGLESARATLIGAVSREGGAWSDIFKSLGSRRGWAVIPDALIRDEGLKRLDQKRQRMAGQTLGDLEPEKRSGQMDPGL